MKYLKMIKKQDQGQQQQLILANLEASYKSKQSKAYLFE